MQTQPEETATRNEITMKLSQAHIEVDEVEIVTYRIFIVKYYELLIRKIAV